MRVFLDTNVLAAAFGTRGLCADVVREVLSRHELLTSLQVEKELERALRKKFGVSPDATREALEVLRQAATRVPAALLWDLSLGDRADIAVVSAALNGEAEVFVTGDREIQGLGSVENLDVLSPRAFWERVREPGAT